MTEQQSTVAGNTGDGNGARKDPSLIPPAIFNAGGKSAPTGKNMFINGEMADRMLPIDMRQQMVDRMNDLANLVNEARAMANVSMERKSSAVGKGFRNYGFMMAANQSMNNFPQLAPNFVDTDSFNDVVGDYLFTRDVAERLLIITNDVRDIMNIFGNLAFDFALAYYANVRSIAERTRDQTAVSVFETLRRFFIHKRAAEIGEESAENELERHFHDLMHGTRDGEIVVKNQSPTVTGKVHEVIDDTHTHVTQAGHKATEEGKSEE